MQVIEYDFPDLKYISAEVEAEVDQCSRVIAGK